LIFPVGNPAFTEAGPKARTTLGENHQPTDRCSEKS
jgi:hypothetical protein